MASIKPDTFIVLLLLVLTATTLCNAKKLSSTFYDKTCPNALPTIRAAIKTAVSKEQRMAASLVRLHFHDCFVQGCDGSILLKDSPTIQTEQTTLRNNNSVRGFEVIDYAKSHVEKICPGVVSCADIVAVAARDASAAVGGPSWEVELGRRDSTTASPARAETDLPGAADTLDELKSLFERKGLNSRDMVALSGAHTIGQARCVTFRTRIYSNTSDIDSGFAATRQRGCPQSGGDSNLSPLDLLTPNSFDNKYFKNLIQKKGLLASDQVLLSVGKTESIVNEYSKNPTKFEEDFAKAMIKMGSIETLTGSKGEIRKKCSVIN